jgi:hypothetical protein
LGSKYLCKLPALLAQTLPRHLLNTSKTLSKHFPLKSQTSPKHPPDHPQTLVQKVSPNFVQHFPNTFQTCPKHFPDMSQTCPKHVLTSKKQVSTSLLCVYYVSTKCLTKSSELSTSECPPPSVHHQVSTSECPLVSTQMSQSVQLNVQVHTQVRDSMIQANPGQTAPT